MSGPARSSTAALEGEDAQRREIVTPEGVPLVFTVARAGDRIAAFLADAVLVTVGFVAILLLLILAGGGGELLRAAVILAVFFLRNAYFIGFESKWQGRTPGKRFVGLRVIDAGGGMLRGESIFVRNLTREVEVFLPLAVLIEPEFVVPGGPPWVVGLSVVWVAVFAMMPLFNRDRLRIGDLLGGTLVVRAPKARLLGDLATRSGEGPDPAGALLFSHAQLGMYGVYELQVLEELLRNDVGDVRKLRTVAERIQSKIGWEGGDVPPLRFLTAFYQQQRARLEQDLLLGKARETKEQGRLGG